MSIDLQQVAQALPGVASASNGSNSSAGTLTGSEIVPVSRGSGFLQTTLSTAATWIMQTFQGFLQNGTGAVNRTVQGRFQDTVSAKDFGATGNGTTDDTAALQAFVTYIVTNSKRGYIPEGTYIISSSLNFPQGGSYSVIGAGKNSTTIQQITNNVPIFSMGGTGSAACVFIEIANMYLHYANAQGTSNTSAYAIYLQSSYYFCSFHHLRWEGYTGFKVLSGQPAPQNTKWDEIDCTAATYGSMMDWTGTVDAGPNWVIGRMQIACNNMVGPAFNNIKGVNANIDCLEFLSPTNCQLMLVQSGSDISINTMKMEVYTYNVAGNLFVFDGGTNIRINQFICYGTTGVFNPASGSFVLFETNAGGNTGSLSIDFLSLTATTVGSGNVYVFQGAVGFITVNTYINDGNANWQLTNTGSSTTCEILSIKNFLNGHISQDNGNITSLAITLGANNTQVFNTALTAPCTVTLPSTGANLFNGLTYTFITNGAVNGSNTIIINNGSATLATLSSDLTYVTVGWRRNASHGYLGWIILAVGSV